MSFQAPFDIMDYARLRMLADEKDAEQQQAAINNITGALTQLGGMAVDASQSAAAAKNSFEGNYRFLTDKGMLPPQTQNAALDLIQRNDYNAANSLISPYLAELDYGRKMQLAGRSGFYDNGMWQPALRAEPVPPANSYGYRVGP